MGVAKAQAVSAPAILRAQNMQKRALSRTRATLDGDELAGANAQISAAQHVHAALAHLEHLFDAGGAQDDRVVPDRRIAPDL